jgi:hypothetical protein
MFQFEKFQMKAKQLRIGDCGLRIERAPAFPFRNLKSTFGIFSRAIIFCGLLMAANSALAQSWTPTGAPTNTWTCVASSADGNNLVASGIRITIPIYTSTNAGETWAVTSAPSNSWNSTASSADGNKLVAVQSAGGWIYTSTNAGATWTSNNAPQANWTFVASSADGNKLAAVNNSPETIYTSTNGGIAWTQATNAPAAIWTSVASSADGGKLAAVNSYPGTLYTSTNGGAVWQRATNAPNMNWICIASSADGNTLIAVVNEGSVYTSADFGNTWKTNGNGLPSTAGWYACASSADGTKLVAVSQKQGIYSSMDSGNDWISNDAPHLVWQAVASSADGNRLAATAWDGGIWISQTAPSPQLNLSCSNGALNFSWLVPSTNFVLQQSSDLSADDWTTLTNLPALNFTNLQEQLTLAPTNNSGFFRLIAQ